MSHLFPLDRAALRGALEALAAERALTVISITRDTPVADPYNRDRLHLDVELLASGVLYNLHGEGATPDIAAEGVLAHARRVLYPVASWKAVA